MGQTVSQMTTVITSHTTRLTPTEAHLHPAVPPVFIHLWLLSPSVAIQDIRPMFSAFVVLCASTHLIIPSVKFSLDTRQDWPVWNL